MYKGGILKSWNKKQAVALHTNFYDTLPSLEEVEPDQADIAWLIYDLVPIEGQNTLQLQLMRIVYTLFKPALDRITVAEPGPIDTFMDILQDKLDEKLEDMQLEVELAGNRLIDNVVLGIIDKKDIPFELQKISEMGNLV